MSSVARGNNEARVTSARRWICQRKRIRDSFLRNEIPNSLARRDLWEGPLRVLILYSAVIVLYSTYFTTVLVRTVTALGERLWLEPSEARLPLLSNYRIY